MKLQSYKLLDIMGVTVWQERLPSLRLATWKIGPRCLVILDPALPSMHPAEEIFLGMIKVLDLSADECSIGTFLAVDETVSTNFFEKVKGFFPETVLVMTSEPTRFEGLKEQLSCPVIFTEHPLHLVEAPLKKRQAYKDLLDLKKILEDNLGVL